MDFTSDGRLGRLSSRAVVPLIAAAACLTPAHAAFAAPSNEVNKRVERSVVQLYLHWGGFVSFQGRDGAVRMPVEWTGRCSGFFVSSAGHIATAGHCVDPVEARPKILTGFLQSKVQSGMITEKSFDVLLPDALRNWKVEGETPGSEVVRTVFVAQPKDLQDAVITDPLTAQMVDFKPAEHGDVALLKVEKAETPPLTVAEKDPQGGDAVTLVGFPGAVGRMVDRDRLRASFKTGTVSSQQINDQGVPQTEVNADASGGMSGGPAIDAEGDVLGITSMAANDQQNFNFITDATDLRDWLATKGVRVLVEQPAPAGANPPLSRVAQTDDSDGVSWLWLLLAVPLLGVLAAAAAVVAVLVNRSRRRGAGTPPGGARTPDATGYHREAAASPPVPPVPPEDATCTDCGGALAPGAAFCGHCGTRIPARQH